MEEPIKDGIEANCVNMKEPPAPYEQEAEYREPIGEPERIKIPKRKSVFPVHLASHRCVGTKNSGLDNNDTR